MKRSVFVVVLSLLIFQAAALEFKVDVSTITDASTYNLDYFEEVDSVESINLTVENSGSIGCQYRLKGEFSYANKTVSRFSQPNDIWPGETEKVELHFLAENYTGPVNVTLSTVYCGNEKKSGKFSYRVLEKKTVNRTLESVTQEADDESATVEIDIEKGLAVPKESPPYWKTSSSRIENGSMTVHYSPPIYDPDQNLTYTIVQEGEPIGETKISLREKPGRWEWIEERLPLLLAVVLVLSVILNAALLYERRRVEK